MRRSNCGGTQEEAEEKEEEEKEEVPKDKHEEVPDDVGRRKRRCRAWRMSLAALAWSRRRWSSNTPKPWRQRRSSRQSKNDNP